MALQDAQKALVDEIYAQLFNQFADPPPMSKEDGLKRLANAMGEAVIKILDQKLEVDVPGINSMPYGGGPATISWKS